MPDVIQLFLAECSHGFHLDALEPMVMTAGPIAAFSSWPLEGNLGFHLLWALALGVSCLWTGHVLAGRKHQKERARDLARITRMQQQIEAHAASSRITLNQLSEQEAVYDNLFDAAPIPMAQLAFDAADHTEWVRAWQSFRQGMHDNGTAPFHHHPGIRALFEKTKVVCLNRSASDFFGIPDAHDSTNGMQWLLDSMDESWFQTLVKLLVEHRVFARIECSMMPAFGARRQTVADFSVLQHQGPSTLLLLSFQDVTDQRREHQAALLAKEEAEEAQRIQATFLTNMSHELKTPLNAIIGFSDLLAEGISDRALLEQVHFIQHSGRHLLGIIKDILELTKVECRDPGLTFTAFSLQQFAQDLVYGFQTLAEEKGIILSCPEPQTPDLLVYADLPKLHHVLTNLIHNAIKFTKVGSVTVECRWKPIEPGALPADDPCTAEIKRVMANEIDGDEQACICLMSFKVSDTGIGIPGNQMSRIFNAFSQGDSSHTRRYGGAGLGLTVCQKLVQLHGGRISCSNREDGGSVFEFDVAALGVLSEGAACTMPQPPATGNSPAALV
jgi:signal transduction histidine kinase